MTRDTFKARGGRTAGHDSVSQRAAGAARLAPRVRALCVVVCCALALQPALITPGRAAARPRPAASGSAAARASRTLLTMAAALGEGVRRLIPDGAEGRRAAAREAAYGPEPAPVFFIEAPPGVNVTETRDTEVVLAWPAVAGAAHYNVERSPNLLSPYAVVGQPTSNGFTVTGLTRGQTHLYRVRAVAANGERSAPSPVTMATAIAFVDGELIGANDAQGRPATRVKAVHVNDLRLAVTGVRGAALLTTSWQEAVASNAPVMAQHVRELRSRLDEGLAALGLTVNAYADSQLNGSPSGSAIRKLHFEQLRARSTRGAGVSGSGVSAYDFGSARLDPSNRTGGAGFDLYSRNFNWSLPVVSLPGRAGLDLGLSLSYNSLVWTRSGNYVLFDGDSGWPAPGFRLGFPVVQGQFFDTQAQKAAYMLVTPGGGRVSLRRTAAPTVYEAGDSSDLQLREQQDGSLELFANDGTRMTFHARGGLYRCSEVRDRNGNFITVAYTAYGDVDYVTDTLGRVIDFEYHTDGYLKQITQTWHREVEGGSPVTETRRWAKFDYEDPAVHVNFPGLTVFGPTAGQTFHALRKVTLADNSSYTFAYTSWGQVNVIENRAEGGGLLNRVRLDLPLDAAQPQADCPRPSARRDWAAYANGDADGAPSASEEAVTSFEVFDGATWTNPENNQPQTGRLGQQTTPDGTVHKEYAHSSGWDEGLVRLGEAWSGGKLKRRTSAAWTQDNEALQYALNPRVSETNVYDFKEDETPHSRRRTEVIYTQFGLPQEVREYDPETATVLRRTLTEYVPESLNAGGAYTDRRLIGLVSKREIFGREGGQELLFSKVTYEYDQEPGCLIDAGAVTQHKAGYGADFKLRGNVCVARRWDVENPSQSVASYTGYDTAGSVVFTRDADGHQTSIEYAAGSRAYPAKVTDPDGFYSTLEHNHDSGALTRTVGPKGAALKTFYDAVGRRLKLLNEVTGGYTRWEYGASGLFVKQWTKVDNDKPESFVINVTDGRGGAVGALREHPGDGTGYAASRTQYDPVNRVLRQYKPSEVSVDVNNLSNAFAWAPAGEDAAPQGWPHSVTEYDWKGRPKRVVDVEGKDKLYEYGGCGCAGGEVVTARGELVPIPGAQTQGRRAWRIYSDVFGRSWKTESLDWGGNVYATTTTKFDSLNRPVRVRKYEGAAPADEPAGEAAGYRSSYLTYDGHGRLKEKHVPEQDDGRNTVYAYNDDDTIKSVTDARGVKAAYVYNNGRHLVSSVSYDVSNVIAGQNVSATPNVSFTYDAAGNREKMTDGFGWVDYDYDTLSRLRSEKRTFSDPDNAAVNGVVRELKYDYNLAGQLKSMTDPFQATVLYGYDKAGRLTSVAPETPYNTTGFNGQPDVPVAEYAAGLKYRAWGALKSLSYGNGLGLSLAYTAGMKPAEFKVSGSTTLMWSKYQHYDDGMLKSVEDPLDHRFDRSYQYDHDGRLAEAFSGAQALSFVKPAPSSSVPYWQKYEYDVWGNTRKRENHYWSRSDVTTADYDTRNRRLGPLGPLDDHDADGNVLNQSGEAQFRYDAAGRNRLVTDNSTSWIEQWHDGAGQMIKRREERRDENGQVASVDVSYYVRSTVLGGAVVSDLNNTGGKVRSRVYALGQVLAELRPGWVTWRHEDPFTGTRGESSRDASFDDTGVRYDPAGLDIGAFDPYLFQELQPVREDAGGGWLLGSMGLPSGRCSADGISIDCAWAMQMLDSGSAVQCPNNDCGPRAVTVSYGGRSYSGLTDPFAAYANGRSGFGMGTGAHRFLLPDGYNLRLTGAAAQQAWNSFQGGMNFGGFAAGLFNVYSQQALPPSMRGLDQRGGGQLGETVDTNSSLPGQGGGGRPPSGPVVSAEDLAKMGDPPPVGLLHLANALQLAKDALRDKQSCRDLFSADVSTSILFQVSNIGFGPLKDGSTANAATSPTFILLRNSRGNPVNIGVISGATITLNNNPNSAFNSGYRVRGVQRYGASDSINRAVTILHELGHMANYTYGDGASVISQRDSEGTPESAAINLANSQRVYDACFGPNAR